MRLIDADKLIEFSHSETSGTNEQIIDWIGEACEKDTVIDHEDELVELCWKVIDGFINVVKTEPTVNEWIPVERELPERYEWVLVAWEEHSTGFRGVPIIAELRRNECWGFQEEMPKEYLDDLDVIAWKPIEPYTGDKE